MSREDRGDSFTTFCREFGRFLWKMCRYLCSHWEQMCACCGTGEIPARLAVIAGIHSQFIFKNICAFFIKPIDKSVELLYIVDTNKKGVIPVKS